MEVYQGLGKCIIALLAGKVTWVLGSQAERFSVKLADSIPPKMTTSPECNVTHCAAVYSKESEISQEGRRNLNVGPEPVIPNEISVVTCAVTICI
jgi:hypothetical protein